MQHDGSNSARARSARIRSEHDYEANRLEAMRQGAPALETQTQAQPRVSLAARLASLFGRARVGLGE